MKNNMLIGDDFIARIRRLLCITVAFFVLVQCNTEKTSIVYSLSEDGLAHHYFCRGADSLPVAEYGDVLVLNLAYKTVGDSLLFSSSEMPGVFRVKLQHPELLDIITIDSVLARLRPGDSLSFFLDASAFYQYSKRVPLPDFLNFGDSLLFTVGVVSIESQEALASEKEKLHNRLQFEEDELVKEYAEKHFAGIAPLPSGMYIKKIKEGDGALPQPGEIVYLDYTMSYLTGEVFYSTLKKNRPFEFEMGEGLVIPGLEAGVARLRKGSHALLLIPSHLAYGSEGYKIIRPFTPLLFEVKVLKR